MKYTVEVLISKDLETVVRELRSQEAAFKWMDTLESFDLIEGELDQIGSKYKMVFNNKGRKEEMVETITAFDPPKQITTTYEMGSVWNECVNKFEAKGSVTSYVMETTFKFGFPWILFVWLMKPMFKKQTLKGMHDFKKYVEGL